MIIRNDKIIELSNKVRPWFLHGKLKDDTPDDIRKAWEELKIEHQKEKEKQTSLNFTNHEVKYTLSEDPPYGLLFADPATLPGEYRPAKSVRLREASEYAKKVKAEENRDVTYEEMQQFVDRE